VKTAKIFLNGKSQAVRLPKEFRVAGPEVWIKKQGQSIILMPMSVDPWAPLVKSLGEFSDDFMRIRAQPTNQNPEYFP
jgi:antitoxin VapB